MINGEIEKEETECLEKETPMDENEESEQISSAEAAWCGLAWGGDWCWCMH